MLRLYLGARLIYAAMNRFPKWLYTLRTAFRLFIYFHVIIDLDTSHFLCVPELVRCSEQCFLKVSGHTLIAPVYNAHGGAASSAWKETNKEAERRVNEWEVLSLVPSRWNRLLAAHRRKCAVELKVEFGVVCHHAYARASNVIHCP